MRFVFSAKTLFASLFCAAVVSSGAGCGGSSGGTGKTTVTASAIVGRALRAPDQKPTAQTLITARHYVCDDKGSCSFTEGTSDAPRATADADGNFVLPLPPGRYFVGFTAPKGSCTGYQDGKWTDVVADKQTNVPAEMTETPTCFDAGVYY